MQYVLFLHYLWLGINSLFSSPAGVLGFFLNAISIVSFLTVKEMRNPSNFFVFNLALADISLNINGLVAAYSSYLRYPTEFFVMCNIMVALNSIWNWPIGKCLVSLCG